MFDEGPIVFPEVEAYETASIGARGHQDSRYRTEFRVIVLSSLIMLGLGTSFACFDVENHRLRVATEIVAGLLLIGGLATLGFGLRFLGL